MRDTTLDTPAMLGGGIVTLLALAHVANDAITSMLGALLPTLQQRFAMTEGTVALLVAVYSFSSSVTQPVFGALSDRLGRRMLAVVGLVLSVGLLGLMAVAPSLGSLFALLVIGGLGSAAFHPAGTIIARSSSRNSELAVGMFSAGGMIGLAVGPLAAIAVASTVGLEYTPWLMAPGLLLGALLNARAPRSAPAPRPSQGTSRTLDLSVLRGAVGRFAMTAILMEVAFVTLTAALPLWLVAERGVARDSALIGWTLAAFYVAAALAGTGAGLLSRRVERRRIVATSLALSPIALFATILVEPGGVAYFAAVAASGALVNAGFPLLIVAAQEAAPRSEATVSGILMGMSVGVAGVLYAGIGALQGTIGYVPAMSIGFVAPLAGAFLALRTKNGPPR